MVHLPSLDNSGYGRRSDPMSTITKLAAETKAQFISDNRELFACLSNL